MGVSKQAKAAYRDLAKWLDHARVQAARHRRHPIAYDEAFCAAADRFISAIKLEAGRNEVLRRANYARFASGPGSPYQQSVAAVSESGLEIYSNRVTPRISESENYRIQRLPSTRFTVLQWSSIQYALGDERGRWSSAQIAALERWAVECDKIIKSSHKLHCDGCDRLIKASSLLLRFRTEPASQIIPNLKDWYLHKNKDKFLGREAILSIHGAINSLMVWLRKGSTLTAKQKGALDFIKARGPVKGLLVAKHIKVAEPTFRTHYLPVLRKHGVKNDGGGYYVAGN